MASWAQSAPLTSTSGWIGNSRPPRSTSTARRMALGRPKSLNASSAARIERPVRQPVGGPPARPVVRDEHRVGADVAAPTGQPSREAGGLAGALEIAGDDVGHGVVLRTGVQAGMPALQSWPLTPQLHASDLNLSVERRRQDHARLGVSIDLYSQTFGPYIFK
mgnify:CR=1 FL=1